MTFPVRRQKQEKHDITEQSQKEDKSSLSCRREASLHLRPLVDPRLTPTSGVLAVLLENVVLPLAADFFGPQYDVIVDVRVIINHTEKRPGRASRAPIYIIQYGVSAINSVTAIMFLQSYVYCCFQTI